MNKKRLLKLADLLEKDAKNPKGIKFDLGIWGEISNSDEPVSCGTTACAMGLAVASGAFKRAGLFADVSSRQPLTPMMPNGRKGFDAAAELFGISWDEAEWLFAFGSYSGATTGKRGELKVAKRIRDFVAGKASPSEKEHE